MMASPLISVAVCTYNGEKFIEEQLISIVNQTYHNIEIIVIDDCSKDSTYEKVKALAGIYPNIKAVQNSQNIGFNKNFEKALSISQGDFIAISDQDDIWHNNKLETLINNILDNWVIFSNSEYIDEQEKKISGHLLTNFSYKNRDYRSLLLYNYVTGHTCLIKKEALKFILPFPEFGFYDWWLGFVSLYHKKLTYCNCVLTKHRIHNNSAMHEINLSQSKREQKEVVRHLKTVLNYPKLKSKDSSFIKKILLFYESCFDGRESFSLICLLIRQYKFLFPDLKHRNWISKLNFARKYTRNLSSKN